MSVRLSFAITAAVALCLAGCDRTSEGRADYEEGRFDDARAHFEREMEEAGADASPELRYDLALAALAAGDPAAAEEGAQRAAKDADADIRALCDFVRGNAAYARSLIAEEEAKKPGADARAYQWAIAATEDALAAWRAAASTRARWPAAQRNIERALLRLDQLRERKQAGGKGKPKPGDGKKPPDKPPPPKPPKPPPPPPDGKGKEPDATIASKDLPAAEVMGILELLREKDRQKRTMRRAQRTKRAAEVERDW